MHAAFCLGSAAPAAGPRILIGRGPAGAGHAPDRQITQFCERMWRPVRKRGDFLAPLAWGGFEWIEFQPDAVILDDRYRGAEAALKALAPVDPGAERCQRPRQRLAFPYPAASIG